MSVSIVRGDGTEVPVSYDLNQKEGFVYELSVNLQEIMTEENIAAIAKNSGWRLKFVGPDLVDDLRGAIFPPSVTKDTPKYASLPMTNCAQVYGSGKHQIVYGRRLDSVITPKGDIGSLVEFANNSRAILNSSAPFTVTDINNSSQKYRDYFSHYLDLKFFSVVEISDSREMNPIRWDSSCKLGSVYTLLVAKTPLGRSEANFGTRTIYINIPNQLATVGELAPSTFLHEFAHAFALIRDEYLYSDSPAELDERWAIQRNCSIVPTFDYRQGDRMYGGKFQGCGFPTTIAYDNSLIPVYRPSSNSIMRQSPSLQFNTVSCGYILASIKDSPTAKQHFAECAAMPGIIPVGQ
jgi:hypothetical protein